MAEELVAKKFNTTSNLKIELTIIGSLAEAISSFIERGL